MGLTIFKGNFSFTEAKVAKNYLTEKELKSLNFITTSGYLDFAERQQKKKL